MTAHQVNPSVLLTFGPLELTKANKTVDNDDDDNKKTKEIWRNLLITNTFARCQHKHRPVA